MSDEKKNINEKPLCWIRHLVINWITTHSRIINIFSVLSFRPLRLLRFFFLLLCSCCCHWATAVVVMLRISNGFWCGRCRRLLMLSSNLAAFMSMLSHTEHIYYGCFFAVLFWIFFLFQRYLVLFVLFDTHWIMSTKMRLSQSRIVLFLRRRTCNASIFIKSTD